MQNQNRDDLRALFRRFLGIEESRTAADEVRRGEQLLNLYPAPEPAPEVLAAIKRQLVLRLAKRRHRITCLIYRTVPAAAAVILVALASLFGHRPADSPEVSYASLIPAAIWESDDISSDDVELAYLTAEIEQIEAQMRALEASESESVDTHALDEVEVELMRLDTEFWKE